MKTKTLETMLIAAVVGLGTPVALMAQSTFGQGQPNQSQTGDPGTQAEPGLDEAERRAEEAQQQSEEAAQDAEQETQDPVEDPAYDVFDAQEQDAFDPQEPDVLDPQDDAMPGTDDSPQYDFDSTRTVP